MTLGVGSKKAGRVRVARHLIGDRLVHGWQGQQAWVLGACERVLRPLVRLALAFGVKHVQLDELLRDILIDEARSAWLKKGTDANISQLSVTTGLNRKAITSKVRESDSLQHTETSAEAKALTLWLQMIADNPDHRSLPIASQGRKLSFEMLARRASRGNVHHRVVLDELVRLKMVTEKDGRVELAAAGFVPVGDLRGMLAFLGDNTRDHLLASVSNTVGNTPALLERSIFASGLSLEDCERIHQLARDRWDGLHHVLTQEMRQACETADKRASGRIRVGIYTYYEDGAAEPAKGTDVSAPKTSGRDTS